MFIILSRSAAGQVMMQRTDDTGHSIAPPRSVARADLPGAVREWEPEHPRWVWDATGRWYPELLREGIRVERCHDLRLSRVILRTSALTAGSRLARSGADDSDDAPDLYSRPAIPADTADEPVTTTVALFDALEAFDLHPTEPPPEAVSEHSDDEHLRDEHAELVLQLETLAGAADPRRLQLLLAAESAGALIAAEMRFTGLPFRRDIHDRMLTDLIGPRPAGASRPERLARLVEQVRRELEVPTLNPDSQAELLSALRRAGLSVTSTRSWELNKLAHPAIGPLLEYKKLSRLHSANGWAWADAWVRDGRFRTEYVVGGVVTGRWATSGGGALQLPKQVRHAVVADPGWKLVVADAAQLEPRVLAALSRDEAMVRAGRGSDLYEGIVASGAVKERAHAKVAMLGAMYGATTGESGRLLPALARAFPRAIAYVDGAARAGERGAQVTSRLGRTSPLPGPRWHQAQARAYSPDASAADERRARSVARDWGRFTRNFVVQASAAEWALCWMGELRRRLVTSPAAHPVWADGTHRVTVDDPHRAWTDGPHLVFFLHDEIIVHTPVDRAEEVAGHIRDAAEAAGRLLFQDYPIDFPVKVSIVDSYGNAS